MKRSIGSVFIALFIFASCGESPQVEILTVASEQANCTGVMPQKCLLIKKEGSDNWEFWYSPIEGFDYEAGYEYKIRVRKEEVANPPADASSLRYVLIKVLSSEEKTSDNLPPSVTRQNEVLYE